MCHANNIMVIQTSQLGQIENLEDQVWIFINKVIGQNCVITNLVSDNLEHLQDNMRLTAHINSSQTRMANLEQKLIELGELFPAVMGQSSSDHRTSDAGGDDEDNQDGGEDNGDTGVFPEGSTRGDSPMPREGGLIAMMEREVEEAGVGGWFNRMDQGVLESWSGHNSDMSASQDHV